MTAQRKQRRPQRNQKSKGKAKAKKATKKKVPFREEKRLEALKKAKDQEPPKEYKVSDHFHAVDSQNLRRGNR